MNTLLDDNLLQDPNLLKFKSYGKKKILLRRLGAPKRKAINHPTPPPFHIPKRSLTYLQPLELGAEQTVRVVALFQEV